jgi:hypothetical protein
MAKYVNWIHLAEDSVQQKVLVNTVMNLQLPEKTELFY